MSVLPKISRRMGIMTVCSPKSAVHSEVCGREKASDKYLLKKSEMYKHKLIAGCLRHPDRECYIMLRDNLSLCNSTSQGPTDANSLLTFT